MSQQQLNKIKEQKKDDDWFGTIVVVLPFPCHSEICGPVARLQ